MPEDQRAVFTSSLHRIAVIASVATPSPDVKLQKLSGSQVNALCARLAESGDTAAQRDSPRPDRAKD